MFADAKETTVLGGRDMLALLATMCDITVAEVREHGLLIPQRVLDNGGVRCTLWRPGGERIPRRDG